MEAVDILDLPMGENDAEAPTIRAYFRSLLSTLWTEEQGFSGKRPFGNSGWQHDVYLALAKGGGFPAESVDEDGEIAAGFDYAEADRLIQQAIAEL